MNGFWEEQCQQTVYNFKLFFPFTVYTLNQQSFRSIIFFQQLFLLTSSTKFILILRWNILCCTSDAEMERRLRKHFWLNLEKQSMFPFFQINCHLLFCRFFLVLVSFERWKCSQNQHCSTIQRFQASIVKILSFNQNGSNEHVLVFISATDELLWGK